MVRYGLGVGVEGRERKRGGKERGEGRGGLYNLLIILSSLSPLTYSSLPRAYTIICY